MTGRPDVSVIVVNYRSAEESRRCVESLRDAFAGEGLAGEIVLVDSGSGPGEASVLAGIPADVTVLLETNRGYAGGINAGLSRARGERVVLSNADVVYHSGAVTELLAAIQDPRVGAAAPVMVWDAEGRVKLPPGYAPGFLTDLAQRLAGRWPALDDRRFRSWARETLELWKKGGPARHLAGAVLAVRRNVFERVGVFDESFPFEYEETEWEDRVRRAGMSLVVAPNARVRHFWAGSASRSPETAARQSASERLYRERRYGRLGRSVLERASPARVRFPRIPEPRFEPAPGFVLGISPNPSRLPFAGADLEREFRLSPEVEAGLPVGRWFFTILSAPDGRPVTTREWEKT
jgi:GT2 family glycosyltransferase